MTKSALSDAVLPFTIPFLNTGKEPKRIPRNSNRSQEIAKNDCVEFNFFDTVRNRMVRVRLSKQLNRIKEYREKMIAFLELQKACTEDLDEGWNPFEKKIQKVSPSSNPDLRLTGAIELFLQ